VAVVLAALLLLLGLRVGDCRDSWVPAASAEALTLAQQAPPGPAVHCDPAEEPAADCCASAGDRHADLANDRTGAAAPSLAHTAGARMPAADHGPLGPPAQPPSTAATSGRATLIGICVSRT
jgi:hypothetical protein